MTDKELKEWDNWFTGSNVSSSVKKFARSLIAEVTTLRAENTLMNELVSDQKRRIKELEEQVNKLFRLLVAEGHSVNRLRNFLSDG